MFQGWKNILQFEKNCVKMKKFQKPKESIHLYKNDWKRKKCPNMKKSKNL